MHLVTQAIWKWGKWCWFALSVATFHFSYCISQQKHSLCRSCGLHISDEEIFPITMSLCTELVMLWRAGEAEEEVTLELLSTTLSSALDPSQLPHAKERVSAETTPCEAVAGSFLSADSLFQPGSMSSSTLVLCLSLTPYFCKYISVIMW